MKKAIDIRFKLRKYAVGQLLRDDDDLSGKLLVGPVGDSLFSKVGVDRAETSITNPPVRKPVEKWFDQYVPRHTAK